jgi:hypothetical protein
MPLRFAHAGDFHLDEDHYFADTAQCLEWFVANAIRIGERSRERLTRSPTYT